MFTGIVRELGRVHSFDGTRLVVETSVVAGVGDSVAVDGVCLTVVAGDALTLAFDVVPETLARTTLGGVTEGTLVNLEPALRAGDALGGHMVQGHVDGTGAVRRVEPEATGASMSIEAPSGVLRYCVSKGAIAVAGVSLTIADVADDAFSVALVPHTLEATTLGALEPGSHVNLEVDVLAKYVERLLGSTISS